MRISSTAGLLLLKTADVARAWQGTTSPGHSAPITTDSNLSHQRILRRPLLFTDSNGRLVLLLRLLSYFLAVSLSR